MDPNSGLEYRTRVTTYTQQPANPDNDKMSLARSVGCFVLASRLGPITKRAGAEITGFRFLQPDQNPIKNLSEMAEEVCKLERPVEKPPKVPDTYPFKYDNSIGESTCYYIGNNVVATCGHCVFDNETQKLKPEFDPTVEGTRMCYVIFNLLSAQTADGANPKFPSIPLAQVFQVERVVAVEYSRYLAGQIPNDTGDWALVKIRPINAQSQLPAALTIYLPQANYDEAAKAGDSLWTVGYPLGTSEKLSVPPGGGRAISAKLKTNQDDATKAMFVRRFLHNLRTGPGSSGSPVFCKLAGREQVIGTHASGKPTSALASYGFEYQGAAFDLKPFSNPLLQGNYGSATQCALWYYLTQETSTVTVVHRAEDGGTLNTGGGVGSLHLTLWIRSSNIGYESVELGNVAMGANVTTSRIWNTLVAAGSPLRPYDLTHVSFQYMSPEGRPMDNLAFLTYLAVRIEGNTNAPNSRVVLYAAKTVGGNTLTAGIETHFEMARNMTENLRQIDAAGP